MLFRVKRKVMLWYLEQQENPCYGIQSNKKTHVLIFRATRKLKLWYLEQQDNPCPSFSCYKNVTFVICEHFTDQT